MAEMEELLDKRSGVAERGLLQVRLSAVRKTVAGYVTQPIVRLLSKTRMSPNDLTWIGFGLTVGATGLIVVGNMFAAGFVVLAASFFDMLDGALARGTNQVTRFGSILDSTLDRVSEAILFMGIVTFHVLNDNPQSTLVILLAGVAMVASFLVSYVRARAEGAGVECEVGLLTRTERIGLLVLGLLLNQIGYVLVVVLGAIGLASLVTVSQRLLYVWRRTKIEGKNSKS